MIAMHSLFLSSRSFRLSCFSTITNGDEKWKALSNVDKNLVIFIFNVNISHHSHNRFLLLAPPPPHPTTDALRSPPYSVFVFFSPLFSLVCLPFRRRRRHVGIDAITNHLERSVHTMIIRFFAAIPCGNENRMEKSTCFKDTTHRPTKKKSKTNERKNKNPFARAHTCAETIRLERNSFVGYIRRVDGRDAYSLADGYSAECTRCWAAVQTVIGCR